MHFYDLPNSNLEELTGHFIFRSLTNVSDVEIRNNTIK